MTCRQPMSFVLALAALLLAPGAAGARHTAFPGPVAHPALAAEAHGMIQEERQQQLEALARALGMTPSEVEALGLSPEEIANLLAGFTEETVVVGSRASRGR